MNNRTKWMVGFAAAIITAVGVWGLVARNKPSVGPPTDAEITNVVEEVMSIGQFYRSPEPNHALTKLAYIRSMEGGSALWEADLPQGARRVLPREVEARRLFGWSPDDRYLMLRDFGAKQKEWLQLYDGRDGSFRRATIENNPQVGQATWLDARRFVYIAKAGDAAELRLVVLDHEHKALRKIPIPGSRDLVAQVSDQTVAYAENHEIWFLDIVTAEATQMTTNVSQEFLWLDYSREKDEFLYCSDDESDWRHLFRLGRSGDKYGKRTQLTFGPEHTYNGQWIQNGKGYAYVGNLTNRFYLAVRSSDPSASTNLFYGGYVVGYRVSADGSKIYATASVGAEPNGIWEYDIATRRLNCIVPGIERPFATSKILPTVERWEKSFDGLEIPYYLLEPRNLRHDRKYPLVISIPHAEGQFDESWEKYAQYLANIGVYHVAVNPRGSDGYGKTFGENHPEFADKDVLAVRKAVLADRTIDKDRVFLLAHSSGGVLVNKLAAEHLDLWAGLILIGAEVPRPAAKPRNMPRYLVFMGEKDAKDLVQRAREFEAWGRTNGVHLTSLYDKNTLHHITDVNVDKRIGFALAEFIFNPKRLAEAPPEAKANQRVRHGMESP